MDNNGLIAIVDIARIHNRSPNNVRRSLRSLEIDLILYKSGKPAKNRLYCRREDYDRVADRLGGGGVGRISNVPSLGYFYLVQLEPKLDPTRFKVGFSVDADGRLAQHRIGRGCAVIVKTWQCKPLWEQTVIDCVAQGCEQLSTEVFRGDLDDVLSRADRFFDAMPQLA